MIWQNNVDVMMIDKLRDDIFLWMVGYSIDEWMNEIVVEFEEGSNGHSCHIR